MPFDNTPESPVIQRLRYAKSRILDPDDWWDGDENERGNLCAALAVVCDEQGTALDDKIWNQAREALENAAHSMGYSSVPILNDTTDHATTMRLFDLAIEQQATAEAGR